MSLGLDRHDIEAAYVEACRLDVAALKPGNVHVFAAGHRMKADDFTESARVSAPFVADPALSVGQRVRRGVEATFAAVGQNTNLGILLLCAPLATAAQRSASAPFAPWGVPGSGGELGPLTPDFTPLLTPPHQGQGDAGLQGPASPSEALAALRLSVEAVLAGLTHDDACEVFQAIAHASPAGLGADGQADVRRAPPAGLTLLDAMRLAAERDLVARQYASRFDMIFDICAGAILPVTGEGLPMESAVSYIFLQLLATQPDTHIARKHGVEVAEAVCKEAADVVSDLRFCTPWDWSRPEVEARLLAFDAALKGQGLNPGSLADIMVAIAFAAGLATARAARSTC